MEKYDRRFKVGLPLQAVITQMKMDKVPADQIAEWEAKMSQGLDSGQSVRERYVSQQIKSKEVAAEREAEGASGYATTTKKKKKKKPKGEWKQEIDDLLALHSAGKLSSTDLRQRYAQLDLDDVVGDPHGYFNNAWIPISLKERSAAAKAAQEKEASPQGGVTSMLGGALRSITQTFYSPKENKVEEKEEECNPNQRPEYLRALAILRGEEPCGEVFDSLDAVEKTEVGSSVKEIQSDALEILFEGVCCDRVDYCDSGLPYDRIFNAMCHEIQRCKTMEEFMRYKEGLANVTKVLSATSALTYVHDNLRLHLDRVQQVSAQPMARPSTMHRDVISGDFLQGAVRNVQRQLYLVWKGQLPALVAPLSVRSSLDTEHAYSIIFERHPTVEDAFLVTVCNAGANSVVYHPCRLVEDKPKLQHALAMTLAVPIPVTRVLNDMFWVFVLNRDAVPSREHTASAIYEIIIPFLIQGKALPEVFLSTTPPSKESSWLDAQYEFQTAAKASSSRVKNLWSAAMPYLLRRVGQLPSTDVRRLLTILRVQLVISAVGSHLPQVERALCDLAVERACVALVKGRRLKLLEDEFVSNALSKFRAFDASKADIPNDDTSSKPSVLCIEEAGILDFLQNGLVEAMSVAKSGQEPLVTSSINAEGRDLGSLFGELETVEQFCLKAMREDGEGLDLSTLYTKARELLCAYASLPTMLDATAKALACMSTLFALTDARVRRSGSKMEGMGAAGFGVPDLVLHLPRVVRVLPFGATEMELLQYCLNYFATEVDPKTNSTKKVSFFDFEKLESALFFNVDGSLALANFVAEQCGMSVEDPPHIVHTSERFCGGKDVVGEEFCTYRDMGLFLYLIERPLAIPMRVINQYPHIAASIAAMGRQMTMSFMLSKPYFTQSYNSESCIPRWNVLAKDGSEEEQAQEQAMIYVRVLESLIGDDSSQAHRKFYSCASPARLLKGFTLHGDEQLLEEEAVLFSQELRLFNDLISVEESEYLLQLLTIPQSRMVPFLDFISNNRVSLLTELAIRLITFGVLFEPNHLDFFCRDCADGENELDITIPLPREQLRTKCGTLAAEVSQDLHDALQRLIRAVYTLAKKVKRVDLNTLSVVVFVAKCIVRSGEVFAAQGEGELAMSLWKAASEVLGPVVEVWHADMLELWQEQTAEEAKHQQQNRRERPHSLAFACILSSLVAFLHKGLLESDMKLALKHIFFAKNWMMEATPDQEAYAEAASKKEEGCGDLMWLFADSAMLLEEVWSSAKSLCLDGFLLDADDRKDLCEFALQVVIGDCSRSLTL